MLKKLLLTCLILLVSCQTASETSIIPEATVSPDQVATLLVQPVGEMKTSLTHIQPDGNRLVGGQGNLHQYPIL